MSDLYITSSTSSPCSSRKRRSAVPRDLIPSMRVPATSSLEIIEFNEWSPYDWWLISRKVSGGFGTAWTGEEYIPGSSSGPKDAEYLPAATSTLTCARIKSRCSLDVEPFEDMSRVVGYPASISPNFVSAYGQYPSRRDRHTESTSAWFGWSTNKSRNRSIFKLQFTRNNSGFILIVWMASWFSNSFRGTPGTGEAVSPQRAVSLTSSHPDKSRVPHSNPRA